MSHSADCSIIAVTDLLQNLLPEMRRDHIEELVLRNMEENWYKNTRPGGPGLDLTLLYVNMLDLFEAINLEHKYDIKIVQLDGMRSRQFFQFERDIEEGFIIANYYQADLTMEDADEEGHFAYVEHTVAGPYVENQPVSEEALFNSMRSIDDETGTARGYILVKERGI